MATSEHLVRRQIEDRLLYVLEGYEIERMRGIRTAEVPYEQLVFDTYYEVINEELLMTHHKVHQMWTHVQKVGKSRIIELVKETIALGGYL